MKKSNDLFFLLMSLILLAIVIMGFGPTFFFKAIYLPNNGPDGLPLYIIIHGLVMTTWMLLLVIQTGLVRTNKVKVHKRLGWFTAGVAVLVIPTAIMVMAGFGPRLLAMGVPAHALREGLSLFFWIDVFSLILFPGLIASALYHRTNTDAHKRFMLYAGITVLVPALARLTAQVAQTESFGGISWPLTWGIMLVIMVSVPVYDALKSKHIHKATGLGFTSILIGMVLSVLIAATEWGKDMATFHFLKG